MTKRGARAVRGAAIAAFATLAASLAHTVGGGAAPGLLALTLSLAFSAPLAMVLTGERMSLLRASAAALVAQAALHLLYSLGAGTGAAGAAPSVAPHTAHAGAASPVDGSVVALVVEHGHAAAMPVAHVAAAALTVAMLASFGRALAAVALAFGTLVRGVWLLASVLRGLPVPVGPGLSRPVVAGAAFASPRLLLRSSLRHRGPPWASSAA